MSKRHNAVCKTRWSFKNKKDSTPPTYKRPLIIAIAFIWTVVILFGAALALSGCSTLPKGWSTSNPVKVSAVVDGLMALTYHADLDFTTQAENINLIQSSASVGADVYLQTVNTHMNKSERLAEASRASQRFSKHYYSDVLKGRSLAATVKESLSVQKGVSPPTDAEAIQGLIIYGVRSHQ